MMAPCGVIELGSECCDATDARASSPYPSNATSNSRVIACSRSQSAPAQPKCMRRLFSRLFAFVGRSSYRLARLRRRCPRNRSERDGAAMRRSGVPVALVRGVARARAEGSQGPTTGRNGYQLIVQLHMEAAWL
jgi:hypothetical protein